MKTRKKWRTCDLSNKHPMRTSHRDQSHLMVQDIAAHQPQWPLGCPMVTASAVKCQQHETVAPFNKPTRDLIKEPLKHRTIKKLTQGQNSLNKTAIRPLKLALDCPMTAPFKARRSHSQVRKLWINFNNQHTGYAVLHFDHFDGVLRRSCCDPPMLC